MEGLTQILEKLHLSTAQHQRRQQPASLGICCGLKTSSDLAPQISDGGPGSIEHLDA